VVYNKIQQHKLRWHATFVKQLAVTCDVNSVKYFSWQTVFTKNKRVIMQKIKYFPELLVLYYLYMRLMDCVYNTSVYKLPITKTCPHFMLATIRDKKTCLIILLCMPSVCL